MTYKSNSDIQWQYGRINEVRTSKNIAPMQFPKWREFPENLNGD